MSTQALTTGEQLDLSALESVVTAGLWTFIEVGEALAEIRDRRLHRATHNSWDAYLRGRWNLSGSYAHRLMQGAEVAGMLPIGKVSSEAVARELAPLRDKPDELREAWAETVDRNGDAPTAAETRAVVEGRAGAEPEDDGQRKRRMGRAIGSYEKKRRKTVRFLVNECGWSIGFTADKLGLAASAVRGDLE